MKLTLIILSFLLLFQTNTQASYARNRHAIAVKAFVLEQKKAEMLIKLGDSPVLSRPTLECTASQFLFCDLEEEEDNSSFNIKKFKLLCGFYLAPPSTYQFGLNSVRHQVITNECYNSRIFCSKYLVQMSLRI